VTSQDAACVSLQFQQYDLGTNEFMYLFENGRGGLKWPADFQLEIVTKAFLVFRVIVSTDD